MAELALLKHLHGAVRSGAGGAAPAFDCAAAQLQALAAPALRRPDAADLAEELVDRAEQLVGSKQAASRLLGLRLLRSTAANCDRRTFMQRHTQWAALLLATLRSEQQEARAGPSPVAAEACSCLAAYFARVGRMLEVPGLRRDGAIAASKLAPLLLQPGAQAQGQQQQQQQVPPSLLALPQAQQALLLALAALPASFRQQQKALEQVLLPLLMQPCSGSGSLLLAACAAALPRIAGDGTAWSSFCQRLLATAHRLADVLLLQLDDQELVAAALALTDPAAKPLPLTLSTGAGSSGAALSSESYASAFAQLVAVLQTLQQLLVQSYPSAVPVPTGGLLLLASRLLSMDDSSGGHASSKAAAANARFPQLCLQLPTLQAATLCLLHRLLTAAGSAATPYFVAAARLLAELLQRSAAAGGGAIASSALARCQLYATARQLLTAAGVGACRHMAPALLQAATFELYGRSKHGALEAAVAAEAGAPARKKARRGKQVAADTLEDAAAAVAAAPLDDLGSAVQTRDLAVQAAALQALEALCVCGAPLLTPQQQRHLDDTAAHIAATSAAGIRQLSSEPESAVGASLAALHLAALRLLLATLLAPAPHRPPHLAPALRLFQHGCGGGGSAALASFCRQALLSCDALLHPRSLPPPASVHRVATAAAENEGIVVPALGVPRFWSSVDAALLLQQEASRQQRWLRVHLEQQEEQVKQAAVRVAGSEGSGGAEAEDSYQHLQQPDRRLATQYAPPAPEAAAPACAALQQAVAAAPPALAQQQQQQQQPAAALVSSMAAMLSAARPAAPSPAAQTAIFALAVPSASAPSVAAAVAVAAAAEEESDSEESLPEIDSGEGSSSESESDGET